MLWNLKGHFKSILMGVNKSVPMTLWDRLVLQAALTLNLMRKSLIALNFLAYAYLNGLFDYNAMPLASLGCAVQVHEAMAPQ